MQSSAKAGLEFHGAVMRYSEVERYGSQYRLLRLGDCDFEFDARAVLFADGDEKFLETIADALSEIFIGSSASSCCVVVHPPTAHTFQTLAPAGSEAETGEALGFESALMFDEAVGADGRIVLNAQPVRSGNAAGRETVFVSEVPLAIRKRLDRLTSGFDEMEVQVVSSSAIVARLFERLSKSQPASTGVHLTVGRHESATEYAVVRDGKLVHYESRDETIAGDVLYFALQALGHAGIDAGTVARVHYYGASVSDEDLTVFTRAFGNRLVPLNPMPVVDLASDRFDEEFKFETFALCLGAAL